MLYLQMKLIQIIQLKQSLLQLNQSFDKPIYKHQNLHLLLFEIFHQNTTPLCALINFVCQYKLNNFRLSDHIVYNDRKDNKNILIIIGQHFNCQLLQNSLQIPLKEVKSNSLDNKIFSYVFNQAIVTLFANLQIFHKNQHQIVQSSQECLDNSTEENNINGCFVTISTDSINLQQFVIKQKPKTFLKYLTHQLDNLDQIPNQKYCQQPKLKKLYQFLKKELIKINQIKSQHIIKINNIEQISQQSPSTRSQSINKQNFIKQLLDQSESSQQSQNEFGYNEQQFFNQIDQNKISNQIYQHLLMCQQKTRQNWRTLQPIYLRLSQFSSQLSLKLNIVGFLAMGIWFQGSQIEFEIKVQKQKQSFMTNKLINYFNKLKNSLNIKSITKIQKYIPTVQIIMNKKHNFQKITLSLLQKQNNFFQKYINFAFQNISTNYYIRPVLYYLNSIFQSFNLSIKPYTIFLMLLNASRFYQSSNLAQFLKNISYYYGFCCQFNYKVNILGEFQAQLGFIDPLNHNNHLEVKLEIPKLQTVFRNIYYSLYRTRKQQLLLYLQELHKIF